jgi:hypothetical protein
MAVQIQFRRATGSDWSTANTVLAEGEMGINTTTNQFKIGNGSTAWNSLSYAPISGTVADLDEVTNVTITSAANGDLLKWNGTAWVNAAGYALLASPALSGTPTAPTASLATNTTQIATTAFVRAEVAALVGTAGSTLDTLGELSDALGDDANFAATTATAIGLKAPLASPVLTGVPEAPTAAADTNSTQIATTAYVVGQGYAKLASPTLTGTPTLPTGTIATTQTAGNNTTAVATTAFVTTAIAAIDYANDQAVLAASLFS